MDNELLLGKLKKIIVEETSKYGNITKIVEYNERLMKCNYFLAKLYSKKNRSVKARVYLGEAEYQLICLNNKLGQRVGFIEPFEKDGEKRRNEKNFNLWSKKIFNLGDRLK
jgi:hypothetical protein